MPMDFEWVAEDNTLRGCPPAKKHTSTMVEGPNDGTFAFKIFATGAIGVSNFSLLV
jgi:hypothetical protein